MKKKKSLGLGALLMAFVLIVFASGCATKGKKTTETDTAFKTDDEKGKIDQIGESTGEGLPNFDPSTRIFVPDGSLATVRFDFDSAEIRADARAILEKNAAIISKASDAEMVQIAGHCDERGTQEYNLALGERRALAVREYLMRLGVPGSRLTTISYGEEVPEDFGSDESAWAVNRRGAFHTEQ